MQEQYYSSKEGGHLIDKPKHGETGWLQLDNERVLRIFLGQGENPRWLTEDDYVQEIASAKRARAFQFRFRKYRPHACC